MWTEAGGQDDIRWYVANRQADEVTYKTTVQTSNHKNGLGIYQVHLYYEYSNGQIEGIATTQTSLSNQGSIKVSAINQLKPAVLKPIISNVSAITSIKSVKVLSGPRSRGAGIFTGTQLAGKQMEHIGSTFKNPTTKMVWEYTKLIYYELANWPTGWYCRNNN